MVHNTNQLSFLLFTLTIMSTLAIIPQGVLAIEYVITNNATKSPGGIVFDKQIGEDYARQTLANVTEFIWQIFQENNETDRKPLTNITLTLQPTLQSGVAGEINNGNHVLFSADTLQPSDDVKTFFNQILFHEMTHIWQWNGNGTANPGLIEGIADYVKLSAFRTPVKQGDGARWDEGYTVTAKFLMYCDSLKKGFVADLNKKMRYVYTDKYFEDLLGKPVDQLWSDYKAKYANANATAPATAGN